MAAIQLDAEVQRVVFRNPQTGWAVVRLTATGVERPVTAVGALASLNPGERLHLEGTWESHPKYGQQFHAKRFEVALPAGIEGIRRYLAHGALPGIGSVTAERLLDHFGDRTLEVLDAAPERLVEVPGIGPTRARALASVWREHAGLRRVMAFFQEHGVNVAHAAELYTALGDDALEQVQQNPYGVLEQVPQIGFEAIDELARRLDWAGDDERRARALLGHLLARETDRGHTYVPRDTLLTRARQAGDVPFEVLDAALQTMSTSGDAVQVDLPVGVLRSAGQASGPPSDGSGECPAVFTPDLYRAEIRIAGRLRDMRHALPPQTAGPGLDGLDALVADRLAVALSDEQRRALAAVLDEPVAVLTGGPGTGKTTLVRALSVVLAARGRRVRLAAPTGRAARRLADVTGRATATIHRLLGYNPALDAFEHNRDNPLDTDVLIVDEASMVDTRLMCHLLEALPLNAALVLVGDACQLPSVGPGNVLADLVASGAVATLALTHIFRQAARSAIVVNAHRVRRGEPLELDTRDAVSGTSEFYFVEMSGTGRIAEAVVDFCRHHLPREFGLDPVADIQVLTPMHRGNLGTLALNQALQAVLNPGPGDAGALRAGDKVMQLKNNYTKEVFNGDIGSVVDVDAARARLTVAYDGRRVAYDATEQAQLSLAYAISVHKSQGSEYPAVVLPLTTQHAVMLQRNLLYTAITRGRRLVVLVGQPRALEVALKRPGHHRRTGLAAHLADGSLTE